MKLCRYGAPGNEKPALIDAAGRIRDLSAHIADIDPLALSKDCLAQLAKIDPLSLDLVAEGVRYGPCVAGTRQFIAIGTNFADHAAESNLPVPQEPVVFQKWVSSIQGANDTVTIPKNSKRTDWEVELALVIGTAANNIDASTALDHVAGYCVVNDISERHWQTERGLTWDKGKGFPGFGPVGPWLVTPDEIDDPQNLDMWLSVNGERMQSGNSRTMIFTIAEIIAYCSQFMTLLPGDIITTGTPPGVGMGKKPEPRYLQAGDVVELGIDGLGTQRQQFVAWKPV